MTTLLNPYFGEFGGMYVPQILMPALPEHYGWDENHAVSEARRFAARRRA